MNNGIVGPIRAMMRVHRIVRHRGSSLNPSTGKYESCELQTVELGAVTGGSPEKNNYSEATPAGKIELSITRPAVVGYFDLDSDYYVFFVKAGNPDEMAALVEGVRGEY